MDAAPPLDILVIEDDADTRANLRDILELDDHRVETAASAAEAMDRDDWARFAAIILDRRLPDGTAEELLPRLKAGGPRCRGDRRDRLRRPPGRHRRPAAGGGRLHPQADQPRRSPRQPGPDRRAAAARLAKERSEAAFRHLVEAAECLIVILRPDHTIVYFSPFAERADRLPGRGGPRAAITSTLFLAEADREAVAEEFDRVIAGTPTPAVREPDRLPRRLAPLDRLERAARCPTTRTAPRS